MKKVIFLLFVISISVNICFSQSISTMSDIERSDEFVRVTERKVKDLELNIKVIGDKSRSRDLRKETINSTVKFFNSENNIFQVSSASRPDVKDYTIRRYLKKLMILKYHRVEIEWFKTRWVTNFRKGPDGKYHGTVRIFQKFTGYNSEGLVGYSDVTSKDIGVVIEVLEMDLGDSTREVLRVLLEDVRVHETS